jgi:hypothetical protein
VDQLHCCCGRDAGRVCPCAADADRHCDASGSRERYRINSPVPAACAPARRNDRFQHERQAQLTGSRALRRHGSGRCRPRRPSHWQEAVAQTLRDWTQLPLGSLGSWKNLRNIRRFFPPARDVTPRSRRWPSVGCPSLPTRLLYATPSQEGDRQRADLTDDSPATPELIAPAPSGGRNATDPLARRELAIALTLGRARGVRGVEATEEPRREDLVA